MQFTAYVMHTDLSDVNYWNTMGIWAEVYHPWYWGSWIDYDGIQVTTANVNAQYGDWGVVPITDGWYGLQRSLKANGNTVSGSYQNPLVLCSEQEQDCGPG